MPKKRAVGPDEATVAGPEETPEVPKRARVWVCPYCGTIYAKDAELVRKNHLERIHGVRG